MRRSWQEKKCRGAILWILAGWFGCFSGVLPAESQAPDPCPAIDRGTVFVEEAGVADGDGLKARVQLRQELWVKIRGLDEFVARRDCLARADGRRESLVLFLDDRPFPGVMEATEKNPESGRVSFALKRNIDESASSADQEAARQAWVRLLGKPRVRSREVRVSVGIEGEGPLRSRATIDFLALPHRWLTFWAVIFFGLVIGFVLLAINSGALRDPGPEKPKERPYSLGRFQAAFWFFLILASYLLIGMVTGDYSSSITGTVVVLLGISGGTTIASAFVDQQKDGQTRRLKGGTRTKRNWWTDVLSDADGVSFHRFQMAAWTLILGVVFAAHVYRDLAMPQFNETLLALLGISSGTFLAMKIPEPNGSEDPTDSD